MPPRIWRSVMYGLFIGTTISSVVLFVFRIIPISTLGMIMILYLYAAVGGISGYIVHKKVDNNPKSIQKVEATTENQIQVEEKPKPEEKNDNPATKQKLVPEENINDRNIKEKTNPAPLKQETVKIENYKQKLDEIKNLKRTSLILKGLVDTRKKLEELKKESNSILEDSVVIMDEKSVNLTKDYLKTS